MTEIDYGFLTVASICVVFTIGLSTEIAYNLGVSVPFDLDQFMRVKDRSTVLLGVLGAMIATLQGVMIYGIATGDSQRMTYAALELAVAAAWIAMLVRNYLARPAS